MNIPIIAGWLIIARLLVSIAVASLLLLSTVKGNFESYHSATPQVVGQALDNILHFAGTEIRPKKSDHLCGKARLHGRSLPAH